MEHVNALPAGTRLGEYEVVDVLGAGGFGITYRAWDTTLHKYVAIKEYLPRDFATRTNTRTVVPTSQADRADYEWGLKRFLDEARTLARFDHSHINKVQRYFEAHGTAYLVLDYIEGETLSKLLERQGQLSEPQVTGLLTDVLSGLEEVHGAGYVHRDIKPGNLMVKPDGDVVVLDFGAARQAVGQRSKSVTSILTPGYAPIEQYDTKAEDVGPWSDIYALGMVAYRCISGLPDGELPDAVTRSRATRKGSGDLEPAASIGQGQYDARLLRAIDWAIQVEENARPQSIAEWQQALPGQTPIKSRATPPAGPPKEPQTTTTSDIGSSSRWAIVAGMVALVVAVGGGAYWLGQRAESPDVISRTPTSESRQADSPAQQEHELVPDSAQRQAESLAPQANPPAPTPSKTVVEAPWAYPFVVETDPAGAEVELLGIEESYRPGLALPVGRYQIEVRAEDYEPQRVWVEHTTGREPHRVVLATERQPFTIVAEPAQARIRIMNIPERYAAGMALPTGEYKVEVSAMGYQTVTETITHGMEPTERRIALVVAAQPFTIVPEPADATVKLLDSEDQYAAGMGLAPGEYQVEVRREGYKTVVETIAHGIEPTERRIALEAEGPGVGETFKDCPVCPQMVVVPAGSFMMGCVSGRDCVDDELPVHRVTIDQPFAVGVYEVTFAEWDACVAGGGCEGYRPYAGGRGRGRRPVINVSWEEAQGYVWWLSEETGKAYRLLSEAEWEYVARAGTTTPYHFGTAVSKTQANYATATFFTTPTEPVGSYAPNAFGLHDVYGNVWEWTQDCWNAHYQGAPSDGRAWERGDCRRRVLRGGSWDSIPGDLRSALRYRSTADNQDDRIGFRIARSLP